MATNFRRKMGEIGLITSFVVLASRNGSEYRNADGCINSGDDLITSFKNMVNFDPVTRVYFAHLRTPPSISSAVSIAAFACRRH